MDCICRFKIKADHLKYVKFLIAAAVIVVSGCLLFHVIDRFQRVVEKQKVDDTVKILRNQLRLKFTDLVVQHRKNDAQYLVGENPMNWLEQKPKNYAGALFGPEAGKVMPGQWYFDLRDRSLIYLIRNCKDKTILRPHMAFAIHVKWAVEKDEISDSKVMRKRLEDIALEQKAPYVCN